MSETTQIYPDKIRAYLATDYRLGHTDNDIILTINPFFPALRSGLRLLQRPSPQKQIPSSRESRTSYSEIFTRKDFSIWNYSINSNRRKR